MYLNLIPQHKIDLEQFILKESFFSRPGKLDLIHTIGHVLHMSVNRNKDGYGITSQNYFAELGTHIGEDPLPGASRSSVCEARQKVSWKAFQFILKKLQVPKEQLPESRKWRGHQVYALDGTKVTLPNSPDILKEFPQRKAGGVNQKGFCHYPFGVMVTACNVLTGQPVAATLENMHGSERGISGSLFRSLQPSDIVLLDRGLDGKKIWLSCQKEGLFYVSRLRVRQGTGGFWGILNNFLASKEKSKSLELLVNNPDKQQQKIALKIRLIRGKKLKDGSTLLLVTNLLNQSIYSPKSIIKLYKLRWEIETMYARFKTLLKVERFHSKKLNGIRQELYANLVVLAIAARLSLTATIDHKLNSTKTQPSFKNAIETFKRYFFYWVSPFRITPLKLGQVRSAIIFQIGRILSAKQPNRKNPRYSRSPLNRWAMAKKHKIKQSQLGRRPGTSADMRAYYRRIDEARLH